MTRYFAIIGAMRTGSNLLEKTLAALGDTICYGEPFNPAFIGGPRKVEVLGWDKELRDADPLAFLEAMITAEPKLIPGFRIFNDHNREALRQVLTDPNCARILLRRDPLDSFISLNIAHATDQWILNRHKRRQEARIRFEHKAYAQYCKKLDQHYEDCERVMFEAGRDALRIDYSDLLDRDALQRVASHIGSIGIPPKDAPLLRQNPGHLSTKVENFHEMCEYLDIELVMPPAADLASANDLMMPSHAPLAIAPIPGPAVLPTVALIQRIEARAFGRPHLPRAELIDGITDNSLFRAGKNALDGRHLITVVCHPVRRALGLFMQTLFASSWLGSSVRHDLVKAHPDLMAVDDAQVFDTKVNAILKPAFSTFLDQLAKPPHRPGDAARHASQAQVLTAYRDAGIFPRVIKLEDFIAEAGVLTTRAGADPVPPGQLASIHVLADAPVLDALAFPEAGHLTKIEALWTDDYRAFDYEAALPEAC